jgi:acetyl esterase/lipase
MTRKLYLSLILLSGGIIASGQLTMKLYENAIPGYLPSENREKMNISADNDTVISNNSTPLLSMFLPAPEKTSGSAVIICPGGGYQNLMIAREGYLIARTFNRLGVAAFVLKYRMPDDRSMTDKSIGPLQDAQRAIQIVRMNADKWHIDRNKIGIMGFSAGGHLASTAGTHFGKAYIENEKGISLRPDFMILIFPVISFRDGITHMGSRNNLLGKSPSQGLVDLFSNELQVTASTPPAFLAHAGDDKSVPVINSQLFYDALKKNSVQAELHIYAAGGHGFLKQPPFEEWFGRCCYWMKTNGWL